MSAKTYRTVPVRNLSSDELLELSKKQKLSLSREDMEVVLPLPSNMGAVSPEAAAASRELDISRMNTSLVPVPNSVSPSGAASQEAPPENVPLPESSVKQ